MFLWDFYFIMKIAFYKVRVLSSDSSLWKTDHQTSKVNPQEGLNQLVIWSKGLGVCGELRVFIDVVRLLLAVDFLLGAGPDSEKMLMYDHFRPKVEITGAGGL